MAYGIVAVGVWREGRCDGTRFAYLQGVSVLEAVGDQFSFGQMVEPGELAPAVSAGIKSREPLVASLQLQGTDTSMSKMKTHPVINTPK